MTPKHAGRAVFSVGLLLASGGLSLVHAQSQVTPDRPGVTDNTQTVPFGAFQIEAGMLFARTSVAASPAERRLSVEAAFRTGLTDHLELRLLGEPLVRLRGAEADTNRADLTGDLRYRFLDAAGEPWWPSLGIEPFVKLPTANAPIGSERTDFGFLALASFELPWQLSLDLNAGLAAVGQTRPNGYLLQALAAASLERAFTERLSMFAEAFFASRGERDGRDALALNAGLVYLVNRRFALDMAAGTGLTGRSPDYFLRAGGSVRFGR